VQWWLLEPLSAASWREKDERWFGTRWPMEEDKREGEFNLALLGDWSVECSGYIGPVHFSRVSDLKIFG
jgi:hypothetical protein